MTIKITVRFLTLSLAFAVGCKTSEPAASATKVAGGTVVTSGDDAALATVALVRPDGFAFCSGVLIAPRHVLTAAHCRKDFTGDSLQVAFGLSTETSSGDHLVAASFRAHPDFDRSLMFGGLPDRPPYDLAVVILKADAPDDHVAARLLTPSDAVAAGDKVWIAGYGLAGSQVAQRNTGGTLRQVQSSIRQLGSASKELLVTGKPQQAACNGDSGGPLYVKKSGQLWLLGLTSRGTGVNCESDTVYTDVRYFRDWVSAQVQ